MNTVSINGTTVVTNSRSVVITNGKIVVDGVDVTPDSKNISVQVQGDLTKLEVAACEKISVTGNVGSISTQSGDVEIGGNIEGSVSTMSGDVFAGDVRGSVSTMAGYIRTRKG